MGLYSLIRPLLFGIDPEQAHRLTVALLRLRTGTSPSQEPTASPLESTVAGLRFPNPVGLGAGFDKDAQIPEQMLSLGFGFVEVGTLTPRPQQGNPKPRLFRLAKDRAVINRMGFNNCGQGEAAQRLSKRARFGGVIGVNIGANKDSPDMVGDYVAGVRAMSGVADYLAVNISSPNTPGLRALQNHGALDTLLSAIAGARQARTPPVFLKVAPDLEQGDPERIVRSAIDNGIDAIIVSNTTVSRPALKSDHAREKGGLSGEPLKLLALDALRRFRSASGGEMPLIGCGGIANADDAWERIRAGASLVQLYSAMVYEGPHVARQIADGLARKLEASGFGSISEAVGSEA